MPVVSKLSPQKNKKFVNVYLDGEYAFGIDLENLYKFGIKVEREFSREEIDEIIHAANYNKTLNKILNYATIRQRSNKEISDWFYKHKVEDVIQPKLIEKLEKLDLLDDEKFAEWWAKQRIEFKSKSKRAIKYELLQKGIKENTIQKVLSSIPIDELEMARKLFEKKFRKLSTSNYDEETKRKKIINHLLYKGFDISLIKRLIN